MSEQQRNEHVICFKCGNQITQQGYKCVDCSEFQSEDISYCQRCFPITHVKNSHHKSDVIDYTQATNTRTINSIIEFERLHLSTSSEKPIIFPLKDQISSIWKRNDFSEIPYRLENEIALKDSIPFVCDYLRMNNSLGHLIGKLKFELCSTDIIILILKYSPLDLRISVIEQLSMFQRCIPIYFGVPSCENSSMDHYFLMRETLHVLLPYIYQKLPFFLSFGSHSCQDKTNVLNTILKTSFDCHNGNDVYCEKASNYYHNQLVQLILGHRYLTERDGNDKILYTHQCHTLDLHGFHDWHEMPHFFIPYMSVIFIHLHSSEVSEIDSFQWPLVTFNQSATYLIFFHGKITASKIETDFHQQILKHFGSNKTNVHIHSAETIVHGNDKVLESDILSSLKNAKVSTDSLLNVPEESIRKHKFKLSTTINTIVKSQQLLGEFNKELQKLSTDDPASDLFPLSRLKELSEKRNLSSNDKQLKEQLTKKRHENGFRNAHPVLTKLAELPLDNDSDMALFEKAILLWNTTLWQRKQQGETKTPVSVFQQLEMSKERFLREFQERSQGYKNLHGEHCSFNDSNRMKDALIQIYRDSFQKQQYIEIINATSSIIYPTIFQEAYSGDFRLNDFFVVGIIGEQSSGKSFAVNKVFGTKISESKFKCTTGILATRVRVTRHDKVKNIVILDTEGLLDQSKTNDEAQIFDRKIVLEVMARSHLILINVTRNVNKTMQQVLEIVLYGLNKLKITNKPKVIFLFRDQDPKTMGGDGQKDHVTKVMDDIKKACEKANFDTQKIIEGFDIHEFPSPFVDLLIGDREISLFSNTFCQAALALRSAVICQLSNLKPFQSFNEWISTTLSIWEQINFNSNLFDYESLLRLTLEKALEGFCNQELTKVNTDMNTITQNLLNNTSRNKVLNDNVLNQIKQQLASEKEQAKNSLSRALEDEKHRLIAMHNLELFPVALWMNTLSRLESSLDRYEIDYNTIATRQLQQDTFEMELDKIPEKLKEKIRQAQTVTSNVPQFEDLFKKTSEHLIKSFQQTLKTDYKTHANNVQHRIIDCFLGQNKIDMVGVNFFQQRIHDEEFIKAVEQAVNTNRHLLVPVTATKTSLLQISNGVSTWIHHAQKFGSLFGITSSKNDEMESGNMFALLNREYTALRNYAYYDMNFLPSQEVANTAVKRIQDAIKTNNITNQDTKNFWFTCYGIMLNLFCEKHCDYTIEKLINKFDQEIKRHKTEVMQSIISATTAEEHGLALISQIWLIIQNSIEKDFENQFEDLSSVLIHYYPSMISKNCVDLLFRSTSYQEMFTYIQNPTEYIKNWLRGQFEDQYKKQSTETIAKFSSKLEKKKKKFFNMICAWKLCIETSNCNRSVDELIDSLIKFLIDGKYVTGDISLTEQTGGLLILDQKIIRIVPENADQQRLLLAIHSTSETIKLNTDERVIGLFEELINRKQLKDRLFERFYNRAKGCGEACPYCKQICDQENPDHTEHRCDYHLLWAFKGYRNIKTEVPSLVCCTSNEAFESTIRCEAHKDKYLPFLDHMQKYNPSWKIINKKTQLQDYQLKAYIALEEDLTKYYKFKNSVDAEIRKKFLRSIVTTHCHALLIGVDYENTSNSLNGIPSYDVSCIKSQLIDSSIADGENLVLLINNEATKQNILEKLTTIVNNMNQRSTFIFYFSGHGGQTNQSVSYLLSSDKQQLTVKELIDVVGKARTNKMIIIFDSCYSGGINNELCFDSNNYKQGVHILCSSHETEVSYRLAGDGNGFFTKYLIKGLEGKFSCETDNCQECATRTANLQQAAIRKVTSTELVLYLRHTVARRQHFTYTSINGSDFDVSFLN